MARPEFTQAVGGVQVDPVVSSSVEASYTNGGTIEVTAYPETVDPAGDLQELIVTETGSDIEVDLTTTGGVTITGVPLRGSGLALDSLALDSVTFTDPDGTGASTYGLYVSE